MGQEIYQQTLNLIFIVYAVEKVCVTVLREL
jgi:hypothetical protein